MKIAEFKKFLIANGAEVLIETNQYELVRFKSNGIVSVVYEGKRGVSFVGEAEAAYIKFSSAGKGNWTVKDKSPRRNVSVKMRTLIDRDGTQCFYCKQEMLEDSMSIEHLLAKVHGGSDHLSNLVLAHRVCNAKLGHLAVIDKVKYRESQV